MMNLYLLYRLAFLTVFMVLITQWKYSIRKLCIILSSVVVFLWIVNSVIYEFTNIDFSNSIYPFTVSAPVFICFLLMSKSNEYKVLFSFITVCNFGMLTSFFGLLAFFFTGSFTIRVLFEFFGVVLIIFLILKVFRKPYFKILNTLDKGWGYLCGVPCLLSAIIYLLLYYPTEINYWPENILITILVVILMFVFYVIVYQNFENITQYYKLKNDKEFMLLQNDFHKKEYTAIMDKVTAIQIFRHDMRHHLTVIHTFLNDNNIPEAENYLNKLNNNLSSTIVEQYCENYMINVILSTYISKAKDEHIYVKCETSIPENIEIDNIELGAILANAIENAIIACKKIENLSERKITIVCKEHYDQIYIQISNSFMVKVQFDGEYPVSNHSDHGIGTRSIAAIAIKYDGVFSFTAEDGIFKVTVILNFKQKSKCGS